MKIACISSQTRGEVDRVLSAVAERLQQDGVAMSGIVRDMSHESRFDNGCDMRVQVLPNGPSIQITQDLGSGSGACRLDPTAITEAVAKVEAQPMDDVGLFMLNKFGPEEAAGRGFCNVIGAAIERGVPVLVGVGPVNRPAFDRFAAGLAQSLPADIDAILTWYKTNP